MAGKKEYELLFALNARMNSGFSGTLSKAQTEFVQLGKEVQSLQRLQGDIASYQKQQTAAENTAAKLENLQKQHELLQKEIGETTGSTASLEREKLKLEQRIQNTQSALEQQRQRLERTSGVLKEAGVDTAKLAQEDAALAAKIRVLSDEQEKAAAGAVRFGERSAQALSAVQQAVVTAGIAAALHEIADAYMDCVELAGGLEAAMSNVEALSGANAAELAALTAEAKALGASTKFTAQESADAMGYMAMAGWDAAEMLSGMDGVLQLAAASGEDLAMVSDIVTDSLSAFGLGAADTAHFSDVLAAAATNANTNVSIMGETFKQSASVAGALGYSIEDVAVSVGLMANSGVKGSIAGTALKNTFNGLLEGATLTATAFGEVDYSAVRADGTMKSFGGTIDELRGYFEQMTEAERVNNAIAIAGREGYNGLLAILNATNEDYAKLTQSINSCTGAAQRIAAIRLDNMHGELTLMRSAWDALQTSIGEQFTPDMRELYTVGTDLFGLMDGFVQQHPALVKGVAAFTGVLGAATAGLTAYVTVAKVAKALDLAALFTGPAGVAVAAIAGVAGLTAAVVGFNAAVHEGVPTVRELTDAARSMDKTMAGAKTAYEDTATATLAAVNLADVYLDRLDALGDYASLSAAEQEQYHNTLALLCEVVPELADSIDLQTNSIEGGTAALRANTAAWQESAKAQAYQEYLNTLTSEYAQVLIEAEQNSIRLTQAQTQSELATQNMEATYQALLAALGMADAQFKNHYGTVKDIPYRAVSDEAAALRAEYLAQEQQLHQSESAARAYAQAIEADSEAVAAAENEIALAEEAVRSLTGATEQTTWADAEAARQTQALSETINQTAAQISMLTEAYADAYNAAQESIGGQYALWDEAEQVAATSAGNINAALEGQTAYWDQYNRNLEALREHSAGIEGLSEVLASFADGSKDSVNAIAGLAGASDADLQAMVQNWQELQQAQSAAAESLADLKTGFSGQMDELQAELAADIAAMGLRNEAAESGKATIQGFIDGAIVMLPRVQAAYLELAQAAQQALSPAGGDVALHLPGYASGTRSAAPGLALVGEQGPELVYFGGGEQVLNAAQTAELQAPPSAAGSGGASVPEPVSIQVNFQIEGSAAPETVQVLERYGSDFARRVLDVLEQYQRDKARRAY